MSKNRDPDELADLLDDAAREDRPPKSPRAPRRGLFLPLRRPAATWKKPPRRFRMHAGKKLAPRPS